MTDDPALEAATAALRDARVQSDALAPCRRILLDVDTAVRSAARAAVEAGLSERFVADQLGVSQPTVHGWCDGRSASPPPVTQAGPLTWTLHYLASAAASQTLRAMGEVGFPGPPSNNHIDPRSNMREAYDLFAKAADLLGRSAMALDFQARKG